MIHDLVLICEVLAGFLVWLSIVAFTLCVVSMSKRVPQPLNSAKTVTRIPRRDVV